MENMTDSNFTYIALVVDRSGSMATMREEAQNGINNFIKEQSKLPGKCRVLLADFDTTYRVVKKGAAKNFPKYELEPRGLTALHDAIGKTVNDVGEELAKMAEEKRPGKVIVVIVTDGQENASREFNAESIKTVIERQQNDYQWEFVFLGANQDAVTTGMKMGIRAESSITYAATGAGATQVYDSAFNYVAATRSGLKASFTEEDRQKALDNQ